MSKALSRLIDISSIPFHLRIALENPLPEILPELLWAQHNERKTLKPWWPAEGLRALANKFQYLFISTHQMDRWSSDFSASIEIYRLFNYNFPRKSTQTWIGLEISSLLPSTVKFNPNWWYHSVTEVKNIGLPHQKFTKPVATCIGFYSE